MIQAKGPKWHKKDKERGVIPKGLRGVDREARWSYSRADNWVYGHGSFSIVSHKIPVLGCLIWMPNSDNEAKKLWQHAGRYRSLLSYVIMDSKADDVDLFEEFKRQRKMRLITRCRKNMNKSKRRQGMIKTLNRSFYQQLLKERSHKIEPEQALVKEIFDLDRCWMRGDQNNRWTFAAMGVAVQMAQLKAWKNKQSTWKIKNQVLGDP